MQLQTLTTDELLRHAEAQRDPLTSTALEDELIRRLQVLQDEASAHQPTLDVANDFEVTTDELRDALQFASDFTPATHRPLLDLLTEFDIDDPDELRKVLQRDRDLSGVLDDLADPMARLTTLITPATN